MYVKARGKVLRAAHIHLCVNIIRVALTTWLNWIEYNHAGIYNTDTGFVFETMSLINTFLTHGSSHKRYTNRVIIYIISRNCPHDDVRPFLPIFFHRNDIHAWDSLCFGVFVDDFFSPSSRPPPLVVLTTRAPIDFRPFATTSTRRRFIRGAF